MLASPHPYTEDQVGAVRRAILHFEFRWDMAAKIDRKSMADSRQRADALAGMKQVYTALRLDPTFEKTLTEQRRQARV
jgi:xylose isomerase